MASIKRKKETLEAKSAGSERKLATHEQVKATKTERVIALLKRPTGATLKAIMALTGWQAHSVRGFLSAQLVKRKGLRVESSKRKGQRFYRIVS